MANKKFEMSFFPQIQITHGCSLLIAQCSLLVARRLGTLRFIIAHSSLFRNLQLVGFESWVGLGLIQ
ncbi:hypothetical protein M426DRAFT_325234 [Hypoxylon sp. CI-4A]|nr:hypothetical protein M426DRAFT_325234 [Hypoxylon sp. CI-4A]